MKAVSQAECTRQSTRSMYSSCGIPHAALGHDSRSHNLEGSNNLRNSDCQRILDAGPRHVKVCSTMNWEKCCYLQLHSGCHIMQAAQVQQEQKALLEAIRPDAISLVDAWAFTDYELNSALGREDGDVYADLLRMAARSPLNATDEGPAWESVLKPTIKQLRSKL